MRSRRIEERRAEILALWEARKDITLDELRVQLGGKGLLVAIPTLQRFFVRHRITRKKRPATRSSRTVPDILRQRRAWFDGQPDLDPQRLVFIDETWTATTMTRSHGRSPRVERLRMGVPHGHRKTTTLIAGLRMSGMVAPMVLDGPVNGAWFAAYVAHVLAPELRRGDVVIMDNLASHKRAAVRVLVEAADATLVTHPEGTLVYAGAIDDQPGNFGADPAKASNNVTQSLLALKRGTPVPTPVTRLYGRSVKYQSGM